MRILFMGTPDFASESLKRLYKDGHDICGVFAQPDKPKGRGMKVAMCPVKEIALEHGTEVYQPVKLRDGTAREIIEKLSPELIVVVAYGRILPLDILQIPKYGCINIHGSVLPKYRGSAPIQRAVLAGERETGVTAMYLAEEMDAGDIIAVKKTEIGENEASGELFDRLAVLGAELLSETVCAIADGTAARTPQDDSLATYAPPIKKEEAEIDWNLPGSEILNKIRGMYPWPVAFSTLGETKFKIHSAEFENGSFGAPGNLVCSKDSGLVVACKDGGIRICQLQAAGGKKMDARDYLRGHTII